MTPRIPTLADLRKLADELETKMHGARDAVRERWTTQVKPKLEELEHKASEKAGRAVEVIQEQLTTLGDALEKLQTELTEDLKLGLGMKKKADETKPDETKPDAS